MLTSGVKGAVCRIFKFAICFKQIRHAELSLFCCNLSPKVEEMYNGPTDDHSQCAKYDR